MTLHRFKLDKLVRDKVPDKMREQGAIVHDRIMDQKEKIIRLKEKLLEEANEVITEANSTEEFLEEFADVIEVITALASTMGITPEQIEKKRQEKQAVKGGFEKSIYCLTIELDSNNQNLTKYIDYFKDHPRYTEIK